MPAVSLGPRREETTKGSWSNLVSRMKFIIPFPDPQSLIEKTDTFFRFLIKEPNDIHTSWSGCTPKINTSYIWHRLGFFTSWTPPNTLVVLCFDLPEVFKSSLTASILDPANEVGAVCPFRFHTILFEKTLDFYNSAVWSFRDAVRGIERVRTQNWELKQIARTKLMVPEPSLISKSRARLHKHARGCETHHQFIRDASNGQRDGVRISSRASNFPRRESITSTDNFRCF